MNKVEAINNLIEILTKYLSVEDFEDNLYALSEISDTNEEMSFGCNNAPEGVERFITILFGKVDVDFEVGREYRFENFKILLDVLLYDVICKVSDKNFLVSDSVLELVELEHDEDDFQQGLEAHKSECIEDYIFMFRHALGVEEQTVEKEDVKEEIEDKERNSYGIWDDLLHAKVQGIIGVYKELYEAGYQMFRPIGVLYEEGIIKPNKEGHSIKEQNALLQGVFNSINSKVGNVFSTKELPHGNCKPSIEYVRGGCKYYPHYQLRNMFGATSPDKKYTEFLNSLDGKISRYAQLESFLEKELFHILGKALMEGVRQYQGEVSIDVANKILTPIIEALETVIVVTEYNRGVALKLKVSTGGRRLDATALLGDIRSGRLLGGSTIIERFTESKGVYTITFVIDKKKYDGFPLFAFQALEAVKRTGKPDWGSVVLGKDVKTDTIFRRSFNANTDFLICLIAGSRSGKGVTTLNLLGSAVGAGYPIFYTDFKPDMSSTFYNLSNKYGVDMYTFDGSWESREFPRQHNVMEDVGSIPEELIEAGLDAKEFALLVSYFRSMELAVTLAKLRQRAVNNGGAGLDELGGERVVLVFDEMELFSIKYRDLFEKYNKTEGRVDIIVNNLTRGMKPADRNMYEPYIYIEDFKSWATSVVSAFSSCMSATFGQGKVSIFMIWQHTDIEEFGMPMRNLATSIKNNAIRIVGNGTQSGNGSKVLGSMHYKGTEYEKYLGQYCFVIAHDRGSEITPQNSTMFKPYLVLNDTSKQYIDELYSRCPEVKDIIETDGVVREDVGFEGYMKALLETSDLGTLLSSSWVVGNTVVQNYGMGSDLLSYMYNLHDFKLKNVGQRLDEEINISEEDEWEQKFGFDVENEEYEDTAEENVFNNDFRDEELNQTQGTFNLPNRGALETIKYTEPIFDKSYFDITEESFLGEQNTTESLKNLALVLYGHIDQAIGEDRVVSVTEQDRYLIVNDVVISPTIEQDLINKLPFDVRREIEDGRWASVFVFGFTRHFKNLTELSFNDTRFMSMKIIQDYGINPAQLKGFESFVKYLFKEHKRLQVVHIGREKILREDLSQGEKSGSRLGELFKSSKRSIEIDDNLRHNATRDNYTWGLGSFYRNPSVGRNTKLVTTVGVGALALVALTNPIGTLAVGYLGGREVVHGSKRVFNKVKSGIKAFSEAFKDSL